MANDDSNGSDDGQNLLTMPQPNVHGGQEVGQVCGYCRRAKATGEDVALYQSGDLGLVEQCFARLSTDAEYLTSEDLVADADTLRARLAAERRTRNADLCYVRALRRSQAVAAATRMVDRPS